MRKKKQKKSKNLKEKQKKKSLFYDEEEDEDLEEAEENTSNKKSLKKESSSFQKLLKSTSLAILFFLIGVFILFSSLDMAGKVGESVFDFLLFLLGWVAYILFIGFFWLGYDIWKDKNEAKLNLITSLAFLVLVFSITGFTASLGVKSSGIVGDGIYLFLSKYFGNILPAIFSLALLLFSFIMIYKDKPTFFSFLKKKRAARLKKEEDIENATKMRVFGNIEKSKSLENIEEDIKKPKRKNIFKKVYLAILNFFKNLFQKAAEAKEEKAALAKAEKEEEYSISKLHLELMNTLNPKKEEELEIEDIEALKEHLESEEEELRKAKERSKHKRKESIKAESRPVYIEEKFTPPPLNLLEEDSGRASAGDSKFKMNTIKKVLEQFGLPVEMGEVTVGPSVTQFTLKPAENVKVGKIISLKDNLQMALSATNMHIEAPIPGKPFVGINIPNEKKAMLRLRSLVSSEAFQNGPNLSLVIGRNIVGKPIISDLTKMPHLLVAGATGTGKSVTLHNLIVSLLYKNSPHDLKLIILDPKRVEFTAYNALPHLYTPIIKDAKTAIKSLSWAAQEMDRRYDVLGEYGVLNLNDYNKKIFNPALEKAKKKAKDGEMVEGLPPKMPFIVIVFDEFNDFMLTYPREITPIITSLTQKARAAGIHIILTTQRPDVKVITGTIKANIPSRIALKTTSQIDSRTILDQAGAEDLLGNGDMLYMNGSNITRVQAPFVSDEEIKSVINSIKKQYDDFIPDLLDIEKIKMSSSPSKAFGDIEEDSDEEPTDDEDYMSARDYVISTGKASTSSLQTAFRWGYNKAARIINDLEKFGIIGPLVSGRHREVLFGKKVESEVEKLERELEEMENDDDDDEEEYEDDDREDILDSDEDDDEE